MGTVLRQTRESYNALLLYFIARLSREEPRSPASHLRSHVETKKSLRQNAKSYRFRAPLCSVPPGRAQREPQGYAGLITLLIEFVYSEGAARVAGLRGFFISFPPIEATKPLFIYLFT